MNLEPPAYWWPEPDKPQRLSDTLKKYALTPASLVYGRVVAERMKQEGEPSTIPVVCVGNFVAGGAGKTPTALAIYDTLSELGMKPAFVTRGYGGSLATTSFRVDYERHRADEVGDEPLLLARRGDTFVGPDRLTSISSAAELGATCTIFDDGLQNPSITKNLAIAVVDGRMGVGNGLCHPAGPLRAPVSGQLHHVDMVVVIGKGARSHAVVRQAAKRGKPVLSATLEMEIPKRLFGRPIFAFSGIGHPSKFFDRLKDAGLNVIRQTSYPDHHPYSVEDATELVNIARERGALLVSTEKDGMRFRARSGPLGELNRATTQIPARLTFEDPSYLKSLLREAIARWKRELALVQID